MREWFRVWNWYGLSWNANIYTGHFKAQGKSLNSVFSRKQMFSNEKPCILFVFLFVHTFIKVHFQNIEVGGLYVSNLGPSLLKYLVFIKPVELNFCFKSQFKNKEEAFSAQITNRQVSFEKTTTYICMGTSLLQTEAGVLLEDMSPDNGWAKAGI